MNSLYREWLSYLLESCSTVLDFLSWTKDEVIWTQSWSIHRVLLRQDTYWLSSNSRPSCSLSQPRIWTSTPTQTCSTLIITNVNMITDALLKTLLERITTQRELLSICTFTFGALVSSSPLATNIVKYSYFLEWETSILSTRARTLYDITFPITAAWDMRQWSISLEYYFLILQKHLDWPKNLRHRPTLFFFPSSFSFWGTTAATQPILISS